MGTFVFSLLPESKDLKTWQPGWWKDRERLRPNMLTNEMKRQTVHTRQPPWSPEVWSSLQRRPRRQQAGWADFKKKWSSSHEASTMRKWTFISVSCEALSPESSCLQRLPSLTLEARECRELARAAPQRPPIERPQWGAEQGYPPTLIILMIRLIHSVGSEMEKFSFRDVWVGFLKSQCLSQQSTGLFLRCSGE